MDRRQVTPQLDARCQGGRCRHSVCAWSRGVEGSYGELSQLSWPSREGRVRCGQQPVHGHRSVGDHTGARAEGVAGERALARQEASRGARLPGPRCGPNIDCNEEQALGDFSRRGSGQGFGEIILIAWERERERWWRHGDKLVLWTSSESCQTLTLTLPGCVTWGK